MKAKLVGIDLSKSVLQVCVIALSGSVLFNKKLTRAKFLEWLKDLEPTTVAMEACATGHFWGRKLQAAGHTGKVVPAQHVKAFCRVHKNDSGDALAITEATCFKPLTGIVVLRARSSGDGYSLTVHVSNP